MPASYAEADKAETSGGSEIGRAQVLQRPQSVGVFRQAERGIPSLVTGEVYVLPLASDMRLGLSWLERDIDSAAAGGAKGA